MPSASARKANASPDAKPAPPAGDLPALKMVAAASVGGLIKTALAPIGQGILVHTTARRTLELVLNDGRTENRWDCDPGVLTTRRDHHVAIVVDGGPKIVSFVVDGRFNDGGAFRQFGWGRFSRDLRTPHGTPELRLAPSRRGDLKCLRVYGRALTTSEAIGNFRSGK